MRKMDDDTRRRVLADLQRFEAMRERVGPLPTPEEYQQITGTDLDAQRKRALLKMAIQSHTLIAHVFDELAESEDHHYDVQKEIRINALWREIVALRDVFPKAGHGQKFLDGRKPGTGGPIRKAIAKLLRKRPALKNPQLWDAVCASPPREWSVNYDRDGLIGPGVKTMSRRRFDTVCGEEREKRNR